MTSDSDPLLQSRADHHRRLMESGFPTRFERTHRAEDLRRQFSDLEPGTETDHGVTVAGRVMLKRSFGKLLFLTLTDVTGSIQLFIDKKTLGVAFEEISDIDLGDWVGATGTVMTTRKGELSVRPDSVIVLQKSLRPLPDKWHGLSDIEQRSRMRYLDLMANETSRAVAIARARIISELRRQFEERGYIEVETPVLLAEATGATARPFQTHHNTLDQTMYLRIATELFLKRLVVGGLEKVFEIGRIFRNEGVDSTHNPEFTMLESYEAFADYTDIMELTEHVIAAVAEAVLGTTTVTYQERDVDLSPPFRRVTMAAITAETIGEAVSTEMDRPTLAAIASRHDIEVDDAWGPGAIVFQLFDRLVEHTIWEPTFVTHHPTEVSPLAARNRDQPEVVDRFELFIAGAEYANAYTELNDAADQRGRFEEQVAARAAGDDEAHPIDEDYLLSLEYGLPPTGGLGIGVDRLVMLLTDQQHIRDVILFPTMKTLP